MAINLRQFGIDWELTPDSMFVAPADYEDRINKVRIAGPNVEFHGVNPNKYKIGGYLGGGTYGSVYECKRASDGLDCVMKIVKDAEAYNFMKEALIQIIIVETTKDKKHPEIGFYGPYAPILYDIAYDKTDKKGYIVSQKMRATVSALLKARASPALKPDLIQASSLVFIQLGTMLSELYRTLGFNHRDFKTDNCMYIRDHLNQVQIRLIDFGFSFIRFHKLKIRVSTFDFQFNSLAKRDLTQFMYELYTYHKYLPAEVTKPLEDLLTFPVGKDVCRMYAGCDRMKEWKNTYEYLNSDKIENPNGDALVVKKVFMKVQMGHAYKGDLAWAPGMMGLFVAKPAVPVKAAKGKIYNPDTGRYVAVSGVVGKRLLAQINAAKAANKNAVAAGLGVKICKEPKPVLNPKTKRCVKACAKGQVRNKSFRCVSAAAAVAPVPAAAAPKACPAAKPNYNPKTRRCLKACPSGKKRNATTFKCV
jgi:hypothetical protein